MAYFEINNLHVTHKSYEGVKTVLKIDHLAIAALCQRMLCIVNIRHASAHARSEIEADLA